MMAVEVKGEGVMFFHARCLNQLINPKEED